MSNKQKLLDELKQLDNRSREILLELDKEYVIELKDKLQSMGFVFDNSIYKMNHKYGQITLSHDFHTVPKNLLKSTFQVFLKVRALIS